MKALLMAFLLVTATVYATLMACHAVLVRLDAAQIAMAETSHVNPFMRVLVCARVDAFALMLFPSERQICRRHDLDKVHVIEGALVGMLLGIIERVNMVIRPHASHASHGLDGALRYGWSEAQLVDLMGEAVAALVLEVVFQIVDVHVAVGERLAGRKVEISHHLVHANSALYSASLFALGVEVLGVVFTLTLLHTLTAAEGP
jgi:hypothetical protein